MIEPVEKFEASEIIEALAFIGKKEARAKIRIASGGVLRLHINKDDYTVEEKDMFRYTEIPVELLCNTEWNNKTTISLISIQPIKAINSDNTIFGVITSCDESFEKLIENARVQKMLNELDTSNIKEAY